MSGPQFAFLPDGRRLHLNHGPIDLIVEVTGSGRNAALREACVRFETLLQDVVDELDFLRRPVTEQLKCEGLVAMAMSSAAREYFPEFVTPMAAVAGAVADEIASVIRQMPDVETAYVNNGGDVALVLINGCSLTADLGEGSSVNIRGDSPVRGLATSGWRGRSQSFGIADTVTVLAATSAKADVAATLIGNHVDLPDHPAIIRAPASDRYEDSDLGQRLVTIGVKPITKEETSRALDAGCVYCISCLQRGFILGAQLTLNGQTRIMGELQNMIIEREVKSA